MDFKNDINYRKKSLLKLLNAIVIHEDEIIKALYDDFKKPAFESVLTETNYIISELKTIIKNIQRWSKPSMILPSLLILYHTALYRYNRYLESLIAMVKSCWVLTNDGYSLLWFLIPK